jgi:DNA modification methylase
MTAIVTQGDAAGLLLPDESVDLIVTSPPYFGLRSYTDGGQHLAGQVGDETTPAEYLDALTACTREWMRVVKPGGSLWVNLGDKYSGAQGQTQTGINGRRHMTDSARVWQQTDPRRTGIPAKSLMLLPQRYAVRCVDQLGLILRAEVIWSKPNGLPESVTDRVRRSHEQLFHFVKQPRYYAAVDEIREPHLRPWSPGANGGRARAATRSSMTGLPDAGPNALGALPGSVWEIATAPLTVPDHLGVDHFAAYPPELVRRIVLGWSPREVCSVCGEGRRPVSRSEQRLTQRTYNGRAMTDVGREDCRSGPPRVTLRTITGWACACPDVSAPATPGVVLDPFGGSGTTALVASVLGRVGISVDLSADYCRIARWRTTDPGERARALQVPKPPVQVDGQLDLFSGLL